MTTEYITILAGNFLQPLVCAVESLVRNPRKGVSGKSNEIELDWAFTAILLSMTMFESWMAWCKHHVPDRVPSSGQLEAFCKELHSMYKAANLPDLTDAVTLRNAIAHNHRWTVEFDLDDGSKKVGMTLLAAGAGNKVKPMPVDQDGRVTPGGLRVVPTLIDRSEVRLVLRGLVETLVILRDEGVLEPAFLNHHAVWPGSGERLTLIELPERIG